MVKNELALMSSKNDYFRNCNVPYYIYNYIYIYKIQVR